MASSAPGPPGTAVLKSSPPSKTLYCRCLPEKMPKDDLKRNLYMLFSAYGVVLDVVALKTIRMRGQAHIVFRDVDSSMQAMRALQDFGFFGKKMQIQFATSDSHTVKKLLGTYQLQKDDAEQTAEPTTVAAAVFGSGPAPTKATPVNAAPQGGAPGLKRARDEESQDEADDDSDQEAAMDVSDSE